MDNCLLSGVSEADENMTTWLWSRKLGAGADLCERSWVERPPDVVAVLDSHVSSVSDSVHGPNPANILQKQNGGVMLDSF